MCGIAGSTNRDHVAVVRDMTARLAHRGPDGEGLWSGGPAVIGHRRLSVIDLVTGDQPMQSPDGALCVAFNGEIYNYRQIRDSTRGYPLRTTSDTECILALASQHESPARWIPELDGMFAFALVQGDDLILARDPLGIKTLYTARKDGAMLFASELKAFPADATEVAEFPPGHWFSLQHGLCPYYLLPRPLVEYRHPWQALRIIKERLEEAVVKRLVVDVPVGVFLSGGLDSSLIAALARRHKQNLHTFSVCMEGAADREPAHQVATHLGTCHHECVYTIEDAVAALPKIIYHLESFDAALVRSAIPNYFLARLAREHVTVALSGEGADELFAGYDYLKALPLEELDEELREITASLHNTNLLRCDRMSMAHGLEVRVPFLDKRVVAAAWATPREYKQYGKERCEKWILRRLGQTLLPDAIAWRAKLKFAAGSGLGDRMAAVAAAEISDAEFRRERDIGHGIRLGNKEELHYYRIFHRFFRKPQIIHTIGRSRSL